MNTVTTKKPGKCSWVIKFGSALMTTAEAGLNRADMEIWAEQIAAVKQGGGEVVIVSSGAVAEGSSRLGWQSPVQKLHQLQAVAAIGQMGLVHAWEACLSKHNIQTAQILLTHDDVANRRRYLNARNCLRTLLELGVVPVVNENDSVAVDEICFGDNDTLAALVANLIEADALFLLTDQEGLYEKDPRHHDNVRLITEADVNDPILESYAGEGSGMGRGGMKTKLQAAKRAQQSGTNTIIAAGKTPAIITRLVTGERIGTLLRAGQGRLAARMRWLASQAHTEGVLHLDTGASQAIVSQGKSLLAVGVKEVCGEFKRGAIVACYDNTGAEVARGLINYPVAEVRKIMGKKSPDIQKILGYGYADELIHRDNLVVLANA